MARLELYRRMMNNQCDAKKLFGEFIEMLIDYFRVFGEKPCCAKDIVLFLDDLKEEQRPELASKLIQLCNISATTLPQTVCERFFRMFLVDSTHLNYSTVDLSAILKRFWSFDSSFLSLHCSLANIKCFKLFNLDISFMPAHNLSWTLIVYRMKLNQNQTESSSSLDS